MSYGVALALTIVGGVPVAIVLAMFVYIWIASAIDGDEDAIIGFIAVGAIASRVCLGAGITGLLGGF